ncbi:MAG: DUF1287 domain-containing protein [Candidatus Omnitrophica bacterium]|nr:DUF1287 domain-containing protein [Candidatus Omnitrophota bacterium]
MKLTTSVGVVLLQVSKKVSMEKIKKLNIRRSQGAKIIILTIIILTAIQVWFLFSSYKEVIIKIPQDLFKSQKTYPETELIVNSHYSPQIEEKEVEKKEELLSTESFSTSESLAQETTEATVKPEETLQSSEGNSEEVVLSEIQKKIVLRLLELLQEDITYGYKVYQQTGYPTENIWASTDVIAMVYKDVGYDLMEIIYEDMKAHKEDYPMDLKKRSEPVKYIDFRDTFFQQQFFKRNALELDNQFILDSNENKIQWQAGDIVYFQMDPDNPNKDLAGFISPHKNEQGVPLVIMISKELGKISEVDKLLEYKVIGHYRYPNPYDEE